MNGLNKIQEVLTDYIDGLDTELKAGLLTQGVVFTLKRGFWVFILYPDHLMLWDSIHIIPQHQRIGYNDPNLISLVHDHLAHARKHCGNARSIVWPRTLS